MTTAPYAKLRANIAGAGNLTGALVGAAGATCQLSQDPAGGGSSFLYQLTDYPEGWALPAGWSADAFGVYFYQGLTPPSFTLPALPLWGKIAPRLTVNNGDPGTSGLPATQFIDSATVLSTADPSGNGFEDIAYGEGNQWDNQRKWIGAMKRNIRRMATALSVAAIACTITSPAPSASLPQGVPVTITGTISVAGTVVVKLGSTVLGSATMSGLTWSYSWTPQFADMGAQTLNATATATVGGATADAAPVAVTVSLPLILTQAGGAQLFWMASSSPGAVDGSAITALTNLSGSNAVFDATNDWGHGAVTKPTYMATGWGNRSPALAIDTNIGFRFTGTDIANCINGIGKAWHIAIVFEPVLTGGTVLYAGGFTASAGTGFASGMITLFRNWFSPGTVDTRALLGSQAAADVVASNQINHEPMILEMWRPDATHVQIAVNGVDFTSVAHASGTNFAGVDAITYGAWGNSFDSGLGNANARYAGGTVHNIVPDRAALRAALKARFSGFDWQTGLGAT